MIDTPHIARLTPMPTAFIHITVPRSEIRNVMHPGLQELRAGIAAQGVAAAGPWFTHHRRIDPEVFDFELSVPVKSAVQAAGRIQPGATPDLRVARTIYHGPYEGLGQAWAEFDAWLRANGHPRAAGVWEWYLAGPDASPDPANWHTQLDHALIG